MPTRIDVSAPNGRARPHDDPAQRYVIGGQVGVFSVNGGVLLAQVYDEVVRRFGPRLYELMENESAVASALWMLKAGALGDGLQLTPKVRAEPGKIVSKRKLRTDIKLSGEIFESCERVAAGLGDGVLYEGMYALLTGLSRGCKLAEHVFELSEEGDDRGRQVPTAFDVLPNWAWAFVCDPYMRVTRYRCWTTEGWTDVDADHFTRFTWMPVDGDPRGSSNLRPCYTPFNVMMQAYPDYGEYLRKFASASLILEAGEKAVDKFLTDPVTGEVKTYTVQQQLVHAGKEFRNHSVLALPNGAKGTVLQSQGTGQAFLSGFDFFERQIFRAVILSTRPMQEAKHGSKADSETGLDVFSMAVGSIRKPLAGAMRGQFWRRYVELNWGPEVARRLTPEVGFGASDHINPDLMAAFADAWGKGLFDEEQRPYIWGKISVPVPEGWAPDREAVRPGTTPPAPAVPGDQGQEPPPPTDGKGDKTPAAKKPPEARNPSKPEAKSVG